MHAVIVHLQCGIRTGPHESDQMIGIVVHFDVGFSDGMVVGPDVIHDYYVSIDLLSEIRLNLTNNKARARLMGEENTVIIFLINVILYLQRYDYRVLLSI